MKGVIILYKVLFHLNEEGKAEDTIRNIDNLLKDMEEQNEDIQIELVVHSSGVYPFKINENAHKDKISSLLNKGVKIVVCSNTLKNLHISQNDIMPGISVVSSGVGELTRKQQEGFLYIKP